MLRAFFVSERCSSLPMWVGDVVVARVVRWVLWITDCLVQPATRAPKAAIAQTPRDAVPSGHCSSASMWVGEVVVARVAWWVPWIADCLVQLDTRAPKL